MFRTPSSSTFCSTSLSHASRHLRSWTVPRGRYFLREGFAVPPPLSPATEPPCRPPPSAALLHFPRGTEYVALPDGTDRSLKVGLMLCGFEFLAQGTYYMLTEGLQIQFSENGGGTPGRGGAQSNKRPTLDLGSGHDLLVCEHEPLIRLCADSAEPAWDSLSLPLSLPLPTSN